MDTYPLVKEQIEAGAELVRRFQEYMPVKAALWLNPSDDGRWQLHIVSPEFDKGRYHEGALEILRLASEMDSPNLDPFQVRLHALAEPMGKAALAIYQEHPGPRATRFRDQNLGGIQAEDVYVYPRNALTPVG